MDCYIYFQKHMLKTHKKCKSLGQLYVITCSLCKVQLESFEALEKHYAFDEHDLEPKELDFQFSANDQNSTTEEIIDDLFESYYEENRLTHAYHSDLIAQYEQQEQQALKEIEDKAQKIRNEQAYTVVFNNEDDQPQQVFEFYDPSQMEESKLEDLELQDAMDVYLEETESDVIDRQVSQNTVVLTAVDNVEIPGSNSQIMHFKLEPIEPSQDENYY